MRVSGVGSECYAIPNTAVGVPTLTVTLVADVVIERTAEYRCFTIFGPGSN